MNSENIIERGECNYKNKQIKYELESEKFTTASKVGIKLWYYVNVVVSFVLSITYRLTKPSCTNRFAIQKSYVPVPAVAFPRQKHSVIITLYTYKLASYLIH